MDRGQFWDTWQLPWTEDQCRLRYVEGPKIGLRKLSEVSGVSKNTLGYWSSEDNWVDRRGRFWDSLQTETQQKTIEKVSDALSDEHAKVLTQHYQAQSQARQLAAVYFATLSKLIADLQKQGATAELMMRHLETNRAIAANTWSLILDRAVKGERVAMGIEFAQDLDAATKALQSAGYEIIPPQDDVTDVDP